MKDFSFYIYFQKKKTPLIFLYSSFVLYHTYDRTRACKRKGNDRVPDKHSLAGGVDVPRVTIFIFPLCHVPSANKCTRLHNTTVYTIRVKVYFRYISGIRSTVSHHQSERDSANVLAVFALCIRHQSTSRSRRTTICLYTTKLCNAQTVVEMCNFWFIFVSFFLFIYSTPVLHRGIGYIL